MCDSHCIILTATTVNSIPLETKHHPKHYPMHRYGSGEKYKRKLLAH
jgi:hypothetical protein